MTTITDNQFTKIGKGDNHSPNADANYSTEATLSKDEYFSEYKSCTGLDRNGRNTNVITMTKIKTSYNTNPSKIKSMMDQSSTPG